MNTRRSLALIASMLLSGAAAASDYALVMPTGAVVRCDELGAVRFKDMPRLYGVNNFSKEYEQYVRFHTYAPRDCARAEERESLAGRGKPQPWRLVAQH